MERMADQLHRLHLEAVRAMERSRTNETRKRQESKRADDERARRAESQAQALKDFKERAARLDASAQRDQDEADRKKRAEKERRAKAQHEAHQASLRSAAEAGERLRREIKAVLLLDAFKADGRLHDLRAATHAPSVDGAIVSPLVVLNPEMAMTTQDPLQHSPTAAMAPDRAGTRRAAPRRRPVVTAVINQVMAARHRRFEPWTSEIGAAGA